VPKASRLVTTASTEPDAPKRDRHGFRGVPPPPAFDFAALADGALLNELDVAAILRVSTNTVASWRRQPAHPLEWRALPNGFVRYTVGAIRAYLARGVPRPRGKPPAKTADTAPAQRKPPAQHTETAEIQDAAPAPRRRAARPRAADTAPSEASS
jgi:hypothetical protein